MPAVSVLLPVFNAMPYLQEAVRSILNQTFDDLELIALNDASTDGSLEYLRSINDSRMVVVARPKSGLSRNLNYGVGIARAQLLARMDADDVSRPERFALQVARMTAEPDLVVCGSAIRFLDPAGKLGAVQKYYTDDTRIRWNLLTDSAIPHPATMLRKSALEKAGLYRSELEPAEDYALWLALSKQGRLANLPEVLLNYRIHPNSVSSQRAQKQRDVVRELSIGHLMERGYATSEPEAVGFRSVARGEAANDPSAIAPYTAVARRFLAEYPAARGLARRKLLGLAKRSRGRQRWYPLRKAIFFQ
jgi:glycosyltransferase involved in cell wall biosynthesis